MFLLYRCIIVRVVLNAVPMLETVPVYHSLNVQFARSIVYHTSLDIYHQMVYLKNGDLFPVSNNFSSVYSPLISLSLNFSYFLFAQTQLASSPSATSNPEPRIVIWILPFHVHKTPNNTPNNGNRNIKHRPNRAPTRWCKVIRHPRGCTRVGGVESDCGEDDGEVSGPDMLLQFPVKGEDYGIFDCYKDQGE